MWTRGAAIRPVPRYAVISASLIDRSEERAKRDDESSLTAKITAMRGEQPHLFDDVQTRTSMRIDDLAKNLLVQMSALLVELFATAYPKRIAVITADDLRAVEQTLDVEEELRADSTDMTFELDDVVSREQPAAVAFLRRVLESSLEDESDRDVDLDDVHAAYRRLLGYLLALSYAVEAPPGTAAPLPA